MAIISSAIDWVLPRNPVTKHREFHLIPEFIDPLVGEFLYPIKVSSLGGFSEEKDYHKLVKEVGEKIAKCSDPPDLPYEFCVIDTPSINAWCLPGGKIAFYKRLIEALEQEESNLGVAELEGVALELKEKVAAMMAHEITHACARHFIETAVFVVFLVIFFNVLRYIIFLLLQNPFEEKLFFKAGKIFSSFSLMNYFFDLVYNKVFSLFECRYSNELEADRYSMLYLQRANYRPEAAIWLQEFFAKKFPTPEGRLGWFFPSEP